MYKQSVCMQDAATLANHLRAVVDAIHPLRTHSAIEQVRGKVHKSEVLLIASIVLVVKAKNICWNTIETRKTMETELSH